MKRAVDLAAPGGRARRVQIHVAGDRRRSLSVGMESGAPRIAIEVKHEARDRRMNERCIEQARQALATPSAPGSQAMWLSPFHGSQAQVTVTGRDKVRRMLADQEYRRCPARHSRSAQPRLVSMRFSPLWSRMRPHLLRSGGVEYPNYVSSCFSSSVIFDTAFYKRQEKRNKETV